MLEINVTFNKYSGKEPLNIPSAGGESGRIFGLWVI